MSSDLSVSFTSIIIAFFMIMTIIVMITAACNYRANRRNNSRGILPGGLSTPNSSDLSKSPPPSFRHSRFDPVVYDFEPSSSLPNYSSSLPPDQTDIMVEVVRNHGPTIVSVGRVQQPPTYAR